MARKTSARSLACTNVVKFITDKKAPPNTGINFPPYSKVDGYRYINIVVQFQQKSAVELPVDLGVIFAFDKSGTMGARRYVNLKENLTPPQSTHYIDVSGSGTWSGSQSKKSC